MSEPRLPIVVDPQFKVGNYGLCPCGCELEGVYRVKRWKDGLRHVKGCMCSRCVGGRQSGKARVREHKVARAAGGAREPMSGNLSGFDISTGLWRAEETANVTLVRGFRRWITSKGVTTKLARLNALTGVRRAFIVSWDGRPQYVISSFEDWANQAQDDLGEAS